MNTELVLCPSCQSPTTYWPAGISRKTGNSYNERWNCENKECGNTIWGKAKEKPRPVSSAPKLMLSDVLKDILNGIEELRADIKDLREEILNK